MKKIFFLCSIAALIVVSLMNCGTDATKKNDTLAMTVAPIPTVNHHFPNFCPYFLPPANVTDTFMLSQDYPLTYDDKEQFPWLAFDFKKDYKAYMHSVLMYCMEGNKEVDFKVQDNKVRKWYSTPWMHNDGNSPTATTPKQNSGREYLHGLTREITIKKWTLGVKQITNYQTYATAFYNAPGGYTIGKVWNNPYKPDVMQSTFPEGTVTFKLLFTEADTLQVPYITNSLKWKANIYTPYNEVKKRTDTDVRLLQLDIAIKDKRAADGSGWVYGTFVYDAANAGKDWVERMAPVGLMWGDDPTDTTMLNITNTINPSLKQSIINAELLGEKGKKANQAYVTHLGMGGRMNGPVENPISSCISCHGRAAVTVPDGTPASIANFSGNPYTYEDFKTYFTEVPCGVGPIVQEVDKKDPDGKVIGKEKVTYYTSDYSFQLANAIRNYAAAGPLPPPEPGKPLLRGAKRKVIPMVSRDGHSE